MGAGGDFRHHAAEGSVLRNLRKHDIGQNAAAAVLGPSHYGSGGLITGRFDAEDNHMCVISRM
jgi:hypothetical protein